MSVWNHWKIAFKSFLKGWKDPKKAEMWLNESSKKKDLKKEKPSSDTAHLKLLYALQKSGRFIDFLKEDISPFTDAQVGAAVRKIHSECGRTIEELVTLRPIYNDKEGSLIHVVAGYNPEETKVVGKVKGEAPYTGILRHKGWKAHKLTLPKQTGEDFEGIVCAAEIEVK